jgi:hypothetical protein
MNKRRAQALLFKCQQVALQFVKAVEIQQLPYLYILLPFLALNRTIRDYLYNTGTELSGKYHLMTHTCLAAPEAFCFACQQRLVRLGVLFH